MKVLPGDVISYTHDGEEGCMTVHTVTDKEVVGTGLINDNCWPTGGTITIPLNAVDAIR
jgi:hypothetical protein